MVLPDYPAPLWQNQVKAPRRASQPKHPHAPQGTRSLCFRGGLAGPGDPPELQMPSRGPRGHYPYCFLCEVPPGKVKKYHPRSLSAVIPRNAPNLFILLCKVSQRKGKPKAIDKIRCL